MVLVLFALDVVPAGDDAVHVGRTKQLFVDDFVIASSNQVDRLLGRVKKERRPIHVEESGGWFYGTVLYHDGRFKLWYRRHKGFGYAESTTGVRCTTRGMTNGTPATKSTLL